MLAIMLAIPKRKPKTKFKGFGNSAKEACRKNYHHFAIELNKEDIPFVNGEPDLDSAEPIELCELHHISISPVTSRVEKHCLQTWCSNVCYEYVSFYELLAEFYVFELNPRAIELGANLARIYKNSCLGDTRIRANSIGHYYDNAPTEILIPQALEIMRNHVVVEAIVSGDKVSLQNRLGV